MSSTDTADDAALIEVLRVAQDLGFIGPGPIEDQIKHGRAFAGPLAEAHPHPARIVDLGSGGGLPALVLGLLWPDARITMVESQARRADFLEEAVGRLHLQDRLTVKLARAEAVGRHPEHRGAYQVATARAFGPPAVVAECAAPLLEVEGVLVVSEPPSQPVRDRWPAAGLAQLGMGNLRSFEHPLRFVSIQQERLCPDRFPRRVGVPTKRPLF